MIYLKLFWSFCQIGLLSFGGGLAALPQIQSQVVDYRGWLSPMEFLDLVTIAEITPGPIALNASTFVGTRVAGPVGAVVATLGCVTPSFVIVLVLAYFYFKHKELKMVQGVLNGLRPAVVGLIMSAGVTIFVLALWGEQGFRWGLGEVNLVSVALFAAGFVALRRFRINNVFVILACGAVGGAVHLLAQ